MAKAETTPTTRRSVLAGLAVVSVLPSVAASAGAGEELLAAERRLAELHERREKILDELEAAETRHRALEQPAKPELRAWRKGETRAEEHAAFEQHAADCRAYRAEEARLRQVSGIEDAERAEKAINEQIFAVIEPLVPHKATTIADLQCKARISNLFGNEDLAWAVVEDLAALTA